MKITDAPYAAGTPEHSEWVREVFLPWQENNEQLGGVGSAASIGRDLAPGSGNYWAAYHDRWRPDDDDPNTGVRVLNEQTVSTSLSLLDAIDCFYKTIAGVFTMSAVPVRRWVSPASSVDLAVNQMTIFFEEFQGLAYQAPKGKIDLGLPDPKILEWFRSSTLSNDTLGGRPRLPYLVEPEPPTPVVPTGLPAAPDVQQLIDRGRSRGPLRVHDRRP